MDDILLCKTVMRKTTFVGYVVLAIYVDDILLTGNDEAAISATKAYLQIHFAIRDLKTPRYFPGIEFTYKSGKLALSQRKYALDFLQETGLLGCKPATSPLEARPKFWDSPMMVDANRYWRLLGKLIYLIVTHPDSTYVFIVLSQFMHEPRMVHYNFLRISSVPLAKGLYIDIMIIFVLRPILMLDMLGTKEIKNLLQGIAYI